MGAPLSATPPRIRAEGRKTITNTVAGSHKDIQLESPQPPMHTYKQRSSYASRPDVSKMDDDRDLVGF